MQSVTLLTNNFMRDDTVGRSSAPFGQSKDRSDTERESFDKEEEEL